MAIAKVQDCSSVQSGAGSPASASLTFGSNITAGNLLVVWVSQTGGAVRTYTVSGGGGSWTQAQYGNTTPDFVAAGLWYSISTGGAVTITVTANTGTTPFKCGAAEFSGFANGATKDASGGIYDGTNQTSHQSVAGTEGVSGGVSSAATDVLSVSTGVLVSTAGECNPDPSYTEVTAGYVGNQTLFQYRIFASAPTNHVGPWSNTVTARHSESVIALLRNSDAPASTPIPVFMASYRRRR